MEGAVSAPVNFENLGPCILNAMQGDQIRPRAQMRQKVERQLWEKKKKKVSNFKGLNSNFKGLKRCGSKILVEWWKVTDLLSFDFLLCWPSEVDLGLQQPGT